MSWLVEKIAIALGMVLLFAVLAGLFTGIPDAFGAILSGELPASPFVVLGFVLMGWIGGYSVGRTRRTGQGHMRIPQGIATALFLIVLILTQRASLSSVSAFFERAPALLVAITVWLMVVVAPWIATSEDKKSNDYRPEE